MAHVTHVRQPWGLHKIVIRQRINVCLLSFCKFIENILFKTLALYDSTSRQFRGLASTLERDAFGLPGIVAPDFIAQILSFAL